MTLVALMAVGCGSGNKTSESSTSTYSSETTSSSQIISDSSEDASSSESSSTQSESTSSQDLSSEEESSEQSSEYSQEQSSEESSSSEEVEKVLEGLLLNTESVQRVFEFNDLFNHDNLIVTASYSDQSTKEVTNYQISRPNMQELGAQQVTVTYSEGEITVSNSYEITIIEKGGEGTPATDSDIQAALQELREFYNTLDIDDYSKNGWKRIVNIFTLATQRVQHATFVEEINQIVETAINDMASVIKQADVTKGTLFDYSSSNSNYEFDRDENNNITISYEGYPGHWVHTGTTKNLEALAKNNNVFELTFSNDIDEQIEVCLQMTDGADFKADSGIVRVDGNSTKTIRLDYDVLCTNLYFFVDSCSVHNRNGHVTILETKFSFEDRPVEDRLYEPKDIYINKVIDKSIDGTISSYTLTEDDHPLLIERISVVIEVKYNGNGSGARWFGFVLHVGSQKSSQLKESQAYGQDIDDGGRFIFNYPLTGKVSAGSNIYGQIAYAADNLTFTVVSYRLHYCVNAETVVEEVPVNTVIYENGSGYIDGDKEKGHLTMSIPYSAFVNRGRVVKMDVKFTTINNESYGKSQVYFTSMNFTHFDSGNNNVLNIGPIMDTSKSGTPTTGTVTIYPSENISLKGDENITAVCWWASASKITIDSITMYTDVAQLPKPVSDLVAHPIDSGVVLNWTSGQYATNYDVYVNDEFYSNVSTTYATINGLTNGTTYTFGVVAKNPTGVTEMIKTQGTPEEGATYDTFIEGINTPLEELIGEQGIATMFNEGNEYLNVSNNERLKSVINKMQNGEETTVAYMGGSITVGENATLKDDNYHQKGYAYYSYQWLKRTYDVNNKSKFVNASISGTGSEIGIVRAQEDVLNHNPDLIFIEFAANNGSTDFYKQTYESLVRKCLALESDPAIILLFSCTSYTLNGASKYMSVVGNHYGLPMYTFDKAMRAVCTPYNNKKDKSGDPIWNAFSNDGTHPNDDGHQLYAKCLCYFLRTLISRETDEPYVLPLGPSASGMDKYESLVYRNNKNANEEITSLGSFEAANTATPSTSKQSDVTAFQNGWKKTDTTVNEPLVIDVNAKNFILIYEAGNTSVAGDPTGNIVVTYTNKNNPSDTGSLTWDVSKTCKQGTSGSTQITDQSGSGWENPVGILIFDKTNIDQYTVSIQMEDATGICTIMAFGYSK